MEEDMDESSSKDSLSVRDNRTGQEYEIEILDGNVIRAMDLRRIRVDPDPADPCKTRIGSGVLAFVIGSVIGSGPGYRPCTLEKVW